MSEPGTLVVVATPIGNLGDLSERAQAVLAEVDLVCCEDTRRTRALLSAMGVAAGRRLLSLHEHNERARVDTVLGRLEAGATVAVVSDAGTPGISDPGTRLVAAAAAAGLPVTAVPGPSAVLAALVVSGLPTDRFCVEGFLARKGQERHRQLAALAAEERTAVVLEAPGRLAATLAALREACGGDRPVAVARELTKRYEEVWRGALGDAAEHFASQPARGEVVVVLGGAPPPPPVDDAALAGLVRARLEEGVGVRDTATEVAAAHGVPRRRVYELALRLANERTNERADHGPSGG